MTSNDSGNLMARPRAGRTPSTRASLLLAACVLLAAGSAVAGPPPVAFADPTTAGTFRGTQSLPTGTHTLDLYVVRGVTPSVGAESVCENGSGDELCGCDVLVEVTGNGYIGGFAEESGVVPDVTMFTSSSLSLSLNYVDSVFRVQGDTDAKKLGALTFVITGTGAIASVRGVECLNASFQKETIANGVDMVIMMPEPGGLLLLAGGVLGLAALSRLRRSS